MLILILEAGPGTTSGLANGTPARLTDGSEFSPVLMISHLLYSVFGHENTASYDHD